MSVSVMTYNFSSPCLKSRSFKPSSRKLTNNELMEASNPKVVKFWLAAMKFLTC